ncbi:MAG: PfkB family carbohydrate kinase [bacterium]|nr:PfkB family carbohydrate kinase [bacterium]
MKKGKILVNGSVVLDTILEEEFFGGTGANISYGLGKLKASPIFFSLAGKDFRESYEPHLQKFGIDSRVCIEETGQTACFFLSKNKKGEDVSVWQSNVYQKIHKISLEKHIKRSELKEVSIAIFSPGTPESIFKHMSEFKRLNTKATVIFDPGQEIYNFSKKALQKCTNLADIFIVNEIEYRETMKILKQDPREVIKDKIIIETKGEKGSLVFQKGKITKISAVRPKRILDLTGAGDAYRAGLIFGLWKGDSMVKACALGARLAAKNIACLGCQRY